VTIYREIVWQITCVFSCCARLFDACLNHDFVISVGVASVVVTEILLLKVEFNWFFQLQVILYLGYFGSLRSF
jgi:hypothetical protein